MVIPRVVRARPDLGWLLLVVTALAAVGWLALVAAGEVGTGVHALGFGACVVIGAARLFNGGKARGPTLLLGLGAAALPAALAIVAELVADVKSPPMFVIAVTIAGVGAALLAALGAPIEAGVAPVKGASEDAPIGRYRLVRKLGVGGMGEVWQGEHDTLARPAALKLIRWQRVADPKLEREMLERFRKEAEVTAQLTSPHAIVLYDFGVADGGILYYAMELLDGVSVQQLVSRHGPLAAARCAFLLGHACHALIEAHDNGLVHRDLKPENLFVAKRGRDEDFLKVLDFGLVKELDAAPAGKRPRMQLTVAGARPGTPGFMAPEQITGTSPVDQRADVYALGCVAFFMLTGGAVFQGKVAAQVMFAHMSIEPETPSARLGRLVHAGLEGLVMACLAKEPAARPTMEELARELALLKFAEPWSQERARAWWSEVEAPREEVISAATRAAGT